MPAEELEALGRRFSRYARASGVNGILFYPQFILMLCDLYRIASPKMVQKKWASSLWREIDVEKCGSINFEAFCDWYTKYFDPVSGVRLKGGDEVRRLTYAEDLETRFVAVSKSVSLPRFKTAAAA